MLLAHSLAEVFVIIDRLRNYLNVKELCRDSGKRSAPNKSPMARLFSLETAY